MVNEGCMMKVDVRKGMLRFDKLAEQYVLMQIQIQVFLEVYFIRYQVLVKDRFVLKK